MQVKKKTKKEFKLLTLIGQLQGRVSEFKLSFKRALDSAPALMQVKKKTEKEFKLLTLRGLAASCSFTVECQN
jgi:hypothetical protein